MKKINFVLFAAFLSISLIFCSKDVVESPDYRKEMRHFVQKISENGRNLKPGFIVIPQNGLALLSAYGTPNGSPETDYIAAIDGVAQEELFYGYDNHDNMPSPDPEHTEWLNMSLFARNHGLHVMIIDYCNETATMDDSYQRNSFLGFTSFQATSRELDIIPDGDPRTVNSNSIDSLRQSSNFLYLIAPDKFSSKEEMIHAMEISKYDVIVMDLFFDQETILTAADLDRLRNKPQGGTRKLICYMSIGQAENYRMYWQQYWYANQPSFILGEDQNWVDNYYVRYWDKQWQEIICGPDNSYLNQIVNAGFDGVYLDLVNAYEYFEE